MTSSDDRESPFASPVIKSERDLKSLLDERTYQTLRFLKRVDYLIVFHCLSIVFLPYAAVLSFFFFGDSSLLGWLVYAFYFCLASIHLLSIYAVIRLGMAARLHPLFFTVSSIFSLCPCIGLFWMWIVSVTACEKLRQQGIPCRGMAPDWDALREMAANMPTEDETGRMEEPQSARPQRQESPFRG